MRFHSLSSLFLGLAALAPAVQARHCQNDIPASKPDSIYQVHGDGSATDTRSGLMWKQCTEGQSWSGSDCLGSASKHTWTQALAQAEASTFAGYDDWRLPNMRELYSLVESCRIFPVINTTVFPSTPTAIPALWWTSTPYALGLSRAWAVGFTFGDGFDDYWFYQFHVRLVRGGR